ncbi:hypothetical protein [Knoellia sinensis]|uniref:hypothetical protein n=1 Tax=Knoellia sinensis TaxID=136100 RepID=UPI000A469EB4|nr:hypothetical protein [Knoellia sinensis]
MSDLAVTPEDEEPGDPPRGRTRLQPGEYLQIDGRTVRLEMFDRDASGKLTALLDTGEGLERVSWLELVGRLTATSTEAADESQNDDDPPVSPVLADLPPSVRAQVEERYQDLLQVDTGSRRGDPDGDRRQGRLSPDYDPDTTTKAQRLERKSRELAAREVAHGSVPTLRRQLRHIRRGGIDALIHGNRKLHTRRLEGVSDHALTVITEALRKEPDRARISDRALRDKVLAALLREKVPDRISQYKLGVVIGELSRDLDLHLDAKGRQRVAIKPDTVYGRRQVSRPGEIVQIDATDTTIHVWDPRLGWAKATILSAIDVFTRCVVALRVVLGKATSRDVSMLICDMGRPMVTRAGWPYELENFHGMPRLVSIVNEVDTDPEPGAVVDLIGRKPAIVPSTIVLDHGKEMDSLHLMSVCARAGVDVVFCPPKAAHAKGTIEALHNTYREIESILGGFKGEHPGNHPADAESRACLTAQDLRDALWEYILNIYNWEPHDGLAELHQSQVPLCPAGIFTAYIAGGGWIEMPSDPWDHIRAMKDQQCIVHPYGVNVDGRQYNSAELRSLRALLARGVGAPARPLTVYWDRWDTDRVYARHPVTGDYLCIPRAGAAIPTRMPATELFDRAVRAQIVTSTGRPLTGPQVSQLRAEFINRHSEDAFASRNEARLAALEASRSRDYAHDLADASPEFRKLAFGDDDVVTGQLVDTTADSDEILDADLADDEDDPDETLDFTGLADDLWDQA